MNLALAKAGLTALTVRRAAVKMIRPGAFGRKGLPAYAVDSIWEDYQRLGSCAKVAAVYGKTRQSIFDILKTHGRPLRKKRLREKIVWEGINFFRSGKGGHFRASRLDQRKSQPMLQRLVWLKKHGSIPVGHVIVFIDGDPGNYDPQNLKCVSKAEAARITHERLYPDRCWRSPEEKREFWRAHGRDYMQQRSRHYVAMGLRSDGLPRATWPLGKRGSKMEDGGSQEVISTQRVEKPASGRRVKLTPLEEAYYAFRAEITKPKDE